MLNKVMSKKPFNVFRNNYSKVTIKNNSLLFRQSRITLRDHLSVPNIKYKSPKERIFILEQNLLEELT